MMNSDHNYGFDTPVRVHPDDFPIPAPEPGMLTVGDVERLAKAGVKVELDRDTMARLVRDIPRPDPIFDSTQLVKPLVERWRQVQERDDFTQRGEIFPFWLSAVKNGGVVYVFVACNMKVFSAHIIEDDAKFYPSEALIAKLHLLLDNHKAGVKS